MKKRVYRRIIASMLVILLAMTPLNNFRANVNASGGLSARPIANLETGKNTLVNDLLGTGISDVNGIEIRGHLNAFATFTGGAGAVGFDQGIILSTGKATDVVGPYSTTQATSSNSSSNNNKSTKNFSETDEDGDLVGDPAYGDDDLEAEVTRNTGVTLETYDAAVIEFKFTPDKDMISFQYVFSSEEYHKYANSKYNDVFAFFVNGSNAAVIPNSNGTPVSINTVNWGRNGQKNVNPTDIDDDGYMINFSNNPDYFVNNLGSSGAKRAITMNGLTVVMSVSFAVNAGVENTIKIAIADGVDNQYDSNVFIKAGSFKSGPATPGVIGFDGEKTTSGNNFIVPINRDGSDGGVSVTWIAKDSNGTQVRTGTVSFKDGQLETEITVPDWTHTIELVNPTNGATIAVGSNTIKMGDLSPISPPTISLSPEKDTSPGFEGYEQLTATLSAAASIIEYTLDDGENWHLYSTPLVLDENVTIKARAKSGLLGSTEVSSEVTQVVDYVLPKSAPPLLVDIDINGTTGIVDVNNVPAGWIVMLFDDKGNLIEEKTNNNEESSTIHFTAPDELEIGKNINIALKEPTTSKAKSYLVEVEPEFEQSSPPLVGNLAASATTDIVIITNVPDDFIVNVYNAGGHMIGTTKNTSGSTENVSITITNEGLSQDQQISVTFTEPRKLESEKTAVTAKYDTTSWNATADDIVANATTNSVTIENVPAGGEIKLHNSDGDVIGQGKNDSSSIGKVTIESISPILVYEDSINVHLTMPNYSESSAVIVRVTRNSDALVLSQIVVDVPSGKATIVNVEPGAVITVQIPKRDANGALVKDGNENQVYETKTVTKRGTPLDDVIIDGMFGLKEGDIHSFTVRNPGQLESVPTSVTLKLTDDQAVNEVARNLKIGFQSGDTWESVTSALFLLRVGEYDTNVIWVANKPEVISIPITSANETTAAVVRQTKEESVIVTATVEKNGKTAQRTFLIIVKALNITKQEDAGASRTVDVVDQTNTSNQLQINRTNVQNGQGDTISKIDKVIFDSTKAGQLTNNASTNGNKATILIDELTNNEADEYAVEVPTGTMKLLAEKDYELDIKNDLVTITVNANVLNQMDENNLDLFFRIVPIKQADQQREVEKRLPSSEEGRYVEKRGQPLTIETNYKDYNTTLYIPFAKTNIDPSKVNLNQLRIYIEHSDGKKVMRNVTVVYDTQNNPIGIQFDVAKFSTFTVVELTSVITQYGPNEQEDEKDKKADTDKEPLYHSAYINGYPDGTFKPNRHITRAELATLFARNLADLSVPAISATEVFNDVSAKHWALSYIDKAMAYGLIIGDKNGDYRPDEVVTRAEMAMIAVRFKALVYDASQTESIYFSDINNHWASSAIDVLKEAHIMSGYEEGTFKPKNALSRAEAVVTLNRLFNRGPLYGITSTLWSDVSMTSWQFADIAEASIGHYYINRPEGGENLVVKE